MVLIVSHHYVVNSGMLPKIENSPFAINSLFFFIVGAWGKTAINGFVMITGYFMCMSQITIKKLLKLVLQIEFYNIILYFIFVFSGYSRFSLLSFTMAILPVKQIGGDFTSAFIIFYLFIPFLNILLRHLDMRMHIRLITLCLFLYTILGTVPKISVQMNYVSWFIVVYFIASFVRLYSVPLFINTRIWGIMTVFSLIVSVCSIVFCLYFGLFEYYFISDSNKILAVITAFCAFMFFNNVEIKSNTVINTIASASFGVLLIHANSDTMRTWLWNDTLHNAEIFTTQWCYLHFACSVIGIYVICTGIDLLRLYLLEKPLFRILQKHFPQKI